MSGKIKFGKTISSRDTFAARGRIRERKKEEKEKRGKEGGGDTTLTRVVVVVGSQNAALAVPVVAWRHPSPAR